MTLDQSHAAMVAALVKPGEDIISETTPLKAHLNHMAMLLSGEAGEVVDAIKKHTIYGKELDYVNVIEELGDIEFALEAIRTSLTIHRDETLAMNMEKLSKRYPQGAFSNDAAQTRADKAPVQEALELTASDAVETGTGYIEVNVTENQSVEVSHVEPSSVSDGFKGEASEFD